MSKWTNFNDVEEQMSYELIPHKTIAKVCLLIKKGNYIEGEFKDGYATLSKAGTSIYLACEFVILSTGRYENRKIWSNIGLYSKNSPQYTEIGRKMIRAILDSAHGLHPLDKSPQAEKLRKIKNFADLENLVFVAEISINDKGDQPRNEVKTIITPAHPDYNNYMNEKNGVVAVPVANEFINDEVPF